MATLYNIIYKTFSAKLSNIYCTTSSATLHHPWTSATLYNLWTSSTLYNLWTSATLYNLWTHRFKLSTCKPSPLMWPEMKHNQWTVFYTIQMCTRKLTVQQTVLTVCYTEAKIMYSGQFTVHNLIYCTMDSGQSFAELLKCTDTRTHVRTKWSRICAIFFFFTFERVTCKAGTFSYFRHNLKK